MKINNKKVFLAQRTASQVLSLDQNARELEQTSENALYLYAVVVADSLKRAAKCKWYQVNKYYRHFAYRKFTVKYLLRNCTVHELTSGYCEVLELEGVDLKKKVPAVESGSTEMSPGV